MRDLLQQRRALIFRIVHRDNIPWIAQHGIQCRSAMGDPNYVNIGNLDLIQKRSNHAVDQYPGGTLNDYVPFYFTPLSPMAMNIKTGWNGITQRRPDEIVVLSTSLHKLVEDRIPFLFSDRHALLKTARFSSNLQELSRIDWKILQARDFKRDNDDLGKMDRYMAEALVHRSVPLASVTTVACFDAAAAQRVNAVFEERRLEIRATVERGWYF